MSILPYQLVNIEKKKKEIIEGELFQEEAEDAKVSNVGQYGEAITQMEECSLVERLKKRQRGFLVKKMSNENQMELSMTFSRS